MNNWYWLIFLIAVVIGGIFVVRSWRKSSGSSGAWPGAGGGSGQGGTGGSDKYSDGNDSQT